MADHAEKQLEAMETLVQTLVEHFLRWHRLSGAEVFNSAANHIRHARTKENIEEALNWINAWQIPKHGTGSGNSKL